MKVSIFRSAKDGFILAMMAGLLSVSSARALQTNFFEGFEAPLTGWLVGDNNPTGTPAYWGRVDAAFGGEGTHGGTGKAYCAATGFEGTSAQPKYRDHMSAYLLRTVDLTGYTNASLSFWYKLPSVEISYDYARVLVDNSVIWSSDQPQANWTKVALSLSSYIGASHELKFEFFTDNSTTLEGWYLDDILVTDGITLGPPPAHDDFSSAAAIVGAVGEHAGSNLNATSEPGEPNPGNSVWYRWTAPTNGQVTFRTGGSAFDTILCVYTGNNLATLHSVGCADNGDTNGASRFQFNAVRGTTYSISVRGASEASGFILLSWSQPNGVGVDHLPDIFVYASVDNNYLHGWYLDRNEQPGRVLLRSSTATPNIGRGALELRGSSGSPDVYQRIYRADGSFHDRFAGTFTFHPDHGHLHFDDWISLRLRAVLPNNEVGDPVAIGHKTSFAIIDLEPFNASLPGFVPGGVYSGGLVQGLTPGWADVYTADLPDQWVDVTDVPNGRYWLEAIVDPENHILESNETNNETRILIDLNKGSVSTNRPPNDDLVNATIIPTFIAGSTGDNSNATRETGEPAHWTNTIGASVWWRWTSTVDDFVVVTTAGSSFDTVLAVYEGTNYGSLTLVARNDDSGGNQTSFATWRAAIGATYVIAVDGYGSERGRVELNFNPAWNDAFARCITLDPNGTNITGSSRGATRQLGEPNHANSTGSKSVWFCWTAPASGTVTFDTGGSRFNTLLGVYTGTAVNALTLVGASGSTGADGSSRVTFEAVDGVEYHIAVDGFGGESGLYQLNYTRPTGPNRPRILAQPTSSNLVAGSTMTFRVLADGTPPMTYQWRHVGTNLLNDGHVQGADTAEVQIFKVLPPDSGLYSVIVSNSAGTATSAPASLIVLDNPRAVHIAEGVEGVIGGVVAVPVQMQSLGDENAIRGSLIFDPAVLANPRANLGAAMNSGTLSVDASQAAAGRLGVTLALPVGQTVPEGRMRELAVLLFDVNSAVANGAQTGIGFTDTPVSKRVTGTSGATLPTLFAAGTLRFHTATTVLRGARFSGGTFRVELQGLPGRNYAIEASSDLKSWQPIATNQTSLQGGLELTDPRPGSRPHQFYRASLVP